VSGQVGCIWKPGRKKELAVAACQRQMRKLNFPAVHFTMVASPRDLDRTCAMHIRILSGKDWHGTRQKLLISFPCRWAA